MYYTYHTDAFILGSAPYGEANKFFFLYTRELGFITASAQSVRAIQSKLRFNLQDFSSVSVSLVRGKEMWRITNVGFGVSFSQKGEAFQIWVRLCSLLRRLLHGEERNDSLFEIVSGVFSYLKSASISELHDAEAIAVLRILKSLGYMGSEDFLSPFMASSDFTPELLARMKTFRQTALSKINQSLRETHL